MAGDPAAPNTLSSGVRGRSTTEGDVPERLRRRYYVDGRGGAGLGFYVDANVKAPAFRDRGRQLVAARPDPNAVRDMIAIAQHRGWSIVVARGAVGFRREAWLAGRTAGIEVHGHRPTERDIQELDRRVAARERSERERDGERFRHRDQRSNREGPGAQSRLQVVDAVVRARVAEPFTQRRIISAARERIAAWLQRGARFEPLRMHTERHLVTEPAARHERNRLR